MQFHMHFRKRTIIALIVVALVVCLVCRSCNDEFHGVSVSAKMHFGLEIPKNGMVTMYSWQYLGLQDFSIIAKIEYENEPIFEDIEWEEFTDVEKQGIYDIIDTHERALVHDGGELDKSCLPPSGDCYVFYLHPRMDRNLYLLYDPDNYIIYYYELCI